MIELNYYTVIHSKFAWVGSIMEMWKLAKKLEYPYFLWNDRVYTTADGEDTGKTIEDIK
jgi:hypothetical protein